MPCLRNKEKVVPTLEDNVMSVSEHQPPATSSASKPQSSSRPRSSSSRRKKDQYVRRPPNPFMLFRSYINDTKLLNLKHQGDLSAHVAKLWNVMSEEKKDEWRVKADEEKRKHKLMYPGYSFQPGKKQRIDEVMAAPKKAMVSANPTSRVKGGQKKLAIVTASSSKTRSDCSPPPPSPTESEQSDAAESDVECEIFPKPFEPPVLYLEQRQFDDEHAEKNAFETSPLSPGRSLSPKTPEGHPYNDFIYPIDTVKDDDTIFDFQPGQILNPTIDFSSYTSTHGEAELDLSLFGATCDETYSPLPWSDEFWSRTSADNQ